MSVLIKNMEKPINCQHCIFADYEGRFCYAAKEYIPMLGMPNFCPITEQKKGKWIKMSDADGIYWACSECGEDIPRTESIDKINFCPNCGADMRGEENG